jgi:hypothetical protein
MKITKQLFAVFLAISLLLTVAPISAMAEETQTNESDSLQSLTKLTKEIISETDTQKVIVLKSGETISFVDESGDYTDDDTTALDTNVASVELMNTDDTVKVAWLGTDANYNTSYTELSNCLYQFDLQEDGNYLIKSTIVGSNSSTDVYLNPKVVNVRPNSTTSAEITITDSTVENTFYFHADSTYMYFYRNGLNHFDRVNTISGYQAPCSFMIFRQASDDEDSKSSGIDGYIQVTDQSEIQSGEKYLIAALYNDTYYLLHPTTSSNMYDHTARVGSNLEELKENQTHITFTANKSGNTSVVIGGTTYNITVLDSSTVEKNIKVAKGDTKTYTINSSINSGVSYPSTDSEDIAEITVQSNSCSIYGKSLGTTTQLVNNILFHITVVDYYDIFITLSKGETNSYAFAQSVADYNISTENPDIATLSIDSEKSVAYFSGVSVGKTYAIIGNTKYSITVVEENLPIVNSENTPFVVGSLGTVGSGFITPDGVNKKLTKLTISVGCKFNIDLSSEFEGKEVTWEVADENIAQIDSNGVVTALAYGSTYMTATIDGEKYTIPLVILDYVEDSDVSSTSGDLKILSLHVSEILNTTVYYSINCSNDLIEIIEGESIYVTFPKDGNGSITFFAKPDEGYALTNIGATNSAGHYLTISGTDDPTQTKYYTTGGAAGAYQRSTFGNETVATMIKEAMDLGCDGATGMTRPASDKSNVNTVLSFYSRKLPTVEKTISKILRGDEFIDISNDDITVITGDVIYYNISVTQYQTNEVITYTDVSLVDNMVVTNGEENYDRTANFVDTGTNQKTISLINTALTENVVTEYTDAVTYTVTSDDIGRELINNISLNYTYSSEYRDRGEGTVKSNTSGQAKVSAFGLREQDIVVDFGLPVTIDYSEVLADTGLTIKSGEAENGTVSVSADGYSVTYTPNDVMLSEDTIILTNSLGGTARLKVYPASTVYYEEGYASYSGNWSSTGSRGDGAQFVNAMTNSTTNYGYDSKYADEAVGYSNSTAALSTSYGDYSTFNFKGTGIEIYASCIKDEDNLVTVQIRNASTNKLVKVYAVNTKLLSGNTQSSDFSNIDEAYCVPIVSNLDLNYDEYTVKIFHSRINNKVGTLAFDGFRVYGTLEKSVADDVYLNDDEDNAVFSELRDHLLGSLNVQTDSDNSIYSEQITSGLNQIYNSNDSKLGIVILNSNDELASYDAQDLLDNGPKNELYLYKGQSAVFSVDNSSYKNIQVGLKAVNQTANFTINSTSKSISSCTDMYYTVNASSTGTTKITITNTGSSILSITKIKLSGLKTEEEAATSNFSFLTLRTKDFMPALVNLNLVQRISGDVNCDGILDVSDATDIQKYLAVLDLDYFDTIAADADNDSEINIKDATTVQMKLAGIGN